MSKSKAATIGIVGAALMVLGVVSLNDADFSQWFPLLLIGGGFLAWFGAKKYRAS